MSVSTKAFPTLGGWHPSYKELFLEFTGSDGKKYRTGLRPKEYPFYSGVPVINGVPDFSQAVFSVDKYGNVRMKNAYIEGTIIAGANSEIDWSYIKNVLVQDAQIESLSADKITAGNGIINALTIKNSLTIGSGGSIKQGQTAYDSGIGFWLGDVAGTPKFSIGNSAGNKLTWDGSTLTVIGALKTGANSLINGQYIDSLDAGKITTGYLSADRIAAKSITADKLNVSQLSAISANLGSITAGSITGITITGSTITGGIVRTSSGNTRIEMNGPDNALYVYQENIDGVAIRRLALGADSIFFYDPSGACAGWILGSSEGLGISGKVGTNCIDVNLKATGTGVGAFWPGEAYLDLGTSTNKFRHLYLSGNIYVDGYVDGVDISAHAANPSAHHTRYTDSEARNAITGYTIYPSSIQVGGTGTYTAYIAGTFRVTGQSSFGGPLGLAMLSSPPGPASSYAGYMYYDTTVSDIVFSNGSNWYKVTATLR